MRIRYSFSGNEHLFVADKAEAVVGRPKAGASLDLDLSPDFSVSRSHARICLEGGQVWIEDLGSRLGTMLGADEIAGKGKQPWPVGETVKIGGTTLLLESAGAGGGASTKGATWLEAIEEVPTDQRGDILQSVDASLLGLPAPGADFGRESVRNAMLHELAIQFASEARLTDLLPTITQRVVEVARAARGALMLKDRKTGDLLLMAHHPAGEPTISLTMAQRAMEKKEAFIWRPPTQTVAGDALPMSIIECRIEHVMCAPLLWRGDVLGVLWLDGSNAGGYTQDDLQFLVAVAHHAAGAVAHQQLQDELRLQTKMLKRLLSNFSPEVGEKLMDQARKGRLRPGGTASEVTILVADLRGFTRAVANLDPEDVADLLSEYFSGLVRCIFGQKGTVDKFIGDAILAVFGSPEPDPKQHEHAIAAALEMQAAMKQLNAARKQRGVAVMDLGIGIHCGTVLHGFIGSEERMEFTVIGDAVNRASRFCDGAGPREVIISQDVYQRVWKKVKAIGVAIKTKHEGELAGYRVDALKAAPG